MSGPAAARSLGRAVRSLSGVDAATGGAEGDDAAAPVRGELTLIDDRFGDLTHLLEDKKFAAGATVVVEYTATLTLDDFDADGAFRNVVTATAVDLLERDLADTAAEVIWVVDVRGVVIEQPDTDAPAGDGTRRDEDVSLVADTSTEVLGIIRTAPATATTGVGGATQGQLPFTGDSTLALLLAGLMAMVVGGTLLLMGGRRSRPIVS